MRIGTKWICVIALFQLNFVSFSAPAFLSRGIINERYSYEDLKLERDDSGTCYLEGSIVNRTHTRKENVWIRIYALNLYGDVLWKLRIRIDVIDKFGTFPFVKKINRCPDKTPYKWEFKVTDRNR